MVLFNYAVRHFSHVVNPLNFAYIIVARLADQLFCKVSTIQDGVSSLPGAAGLLWLRRRTYQPGCVAGGRRGGTATNSEAVGGRCPAM